MCNYSGRYKHALIVGARGIGKSTLIQHVLKELDQPVSGFLTKKETSLADEQSNSPVYIYDPGTHSRTSENQVGACGTHGFAVIKGAFDRYAPRLLAPIPENHVVVMDEIGFMESEEKVFCNAVLSLLDGEVPVIAAVKNKDVPFLETVRSHPKCRCFYITKENRDALFQEVMDFMKKKIGERKEYIVGESSHLGSFPNAADLDYFISLQGQEPSGRREFSHAKWDQRAEIWNQERIRNRKGDERVDSAVAYLEQRGLLRAEHDVADIGCGLGRFAAAFARRVRSVVGLDVSEKMICYGREYIEKEGLPNVLLRTCDFDAIDIEKEGYEKAFDLVFCSLTPAVHNMESLQKAMEMSRAYCCNITHIYSQNNLRDQLMREVFRKEPPVGRSGRWFYSLFNVLFLMGYCPETSYETRHQELRVRPDEEYVEFVMEHMLTAEEQTKENGEKILRWLQKHADAEGFLTEIIDSCYGRVLWDVHHRTSRPDYRSMEQGF